MIKRAIIGTILGILVGASGIFLIDLLAVFVMWDINEMFGLFRDGPKVVRFFILISGLLGLILGLVSKERK